MPNCCWWEVFYWEDSMNFTCSRHLPGDEWPTRRPAGGKPFHLGPVGWSQSAPLCGPPAEQSAQRTGAGGCLQMPGVHRSRVTNGLYQNGEKPLYSVHFIIRHARFPEMAWIQAQTHRFQAIISGQFVYKVRISDHFQAQQWIPAGIPVGGKYWEIPGNTGQYWEVPGQYLEIPKDVYTHICDEEQD